VLEGRIDAHMRKDAHIVIKRFNDQSISLGYEHTMLDIKMQDLAVTMAEQFIK